MQRRPSGRRRREFDGVEIHSAHGYLLNQFYSPLTNKRKDAYGADTMSNRLRLHTEVIKAVREAVGQDYPLALRLGACDYMEGRFHPAGRRRGGEASRAGGGSTCWISPAAFAGMCAPM